MSKPNPGKAKVNAIGRAVKAKELYGGRPIIPDELTEVESLRLALAQEKLTNLQLQFQVEETTFRQLITSIVQARGKDPLKWGVNLVAGKILPIEAVASPVVVPPSDGDDLKGKEELKGELEKEVKGKEVAKAS